MKAIQKPPGLRRATEIVARPVRMLIYGEPGVGKTTLIGTSPKPIFLIDFESGADIRLAGQEGIDILSVYSYGELKSALEWVKEQAEYKTVAFDGFSLFVSQVMREILEERAKPSPTFYEWSLLTQRIKEVILSLLKPNANTIFTALTKKQEQDGKLVWVGPDLPKKIRETLRAIVDLEGLIWVEEGQRFLSFTSSKGIAETKDRSGRLSPKEEPDISKLLQKLFSKEGGK